MIWSNIFPRPNGQFLDLGGVKTLARIVCALLSSFWQCQKQTTKQGPKKVLHDAWLTEGGGGWKLFGQCPHGNNTYHKASLKCLHCQCWHWIYDQCFTLIKIRWTKVNNGFCSTRTQGHTAVCKAKYIQLHVLVYSFAPYFQIVYLYRCTHQGHQVSTRWAADVGPNLCHPWGKVAFRRI